MFSDHLQGKIDEVRIEHLNYMEDGKETWFETRAKAVFENGKATRISGLIENIDTRKALENKVEEAPKIAEKVEKIEKVQEEVIITEKKIEELKDEGIEISSVPWIQDDH